MIFFVIPLLGLLVLLTPLEVIRRAKRRTVKQFEDQSSLEASRAVWQVSKRCILYTLLLGLALEALGWTLGSFGMGSRDQYLAAIDLVILTCILLPFPLFASALMGALIPVRRDVVERY